MTPQERQTKLARFRDAHQELAEALKPLTKEEIAYKPAPEKWSVHEIVVHIADAEANSYVRLRKTLAEPGQTVMVYDQDKWASALGYQSLEMSEYLELFRLLRKLSYDLIKDMPESDWAKQYSHPDNGLVGLDRWLDMYAGHVTGHVRQIERNLAHKKSNESVNA